MERRVKQCSDIRKEDVESNKTVTVNCQKLRINTQAKCLDVTVTADEKHLSTSMERKTMVDAPPTPEKGDI